MCCGTSSTVVSLPIGLPPIESPTEIPTMTFPLRVFKRHAPPCGCTDVRRGDRQRGGRSPAPAGCGCGRPGAARRARRSSSRRRTSTGTGRTTRRTFGSCSSRASSARLSAMPSGRRPCGAATRASSWSRSASSRARLPRPARPRHAGRGRRRQERRVRDRATGRPADRRRLRRRFRARPEPGGSVAVMRRSRPLTGAVLALIAAWGVVSVAELPPLSHSLQVDDARVPLAIVAGDRRPLLRVRSGRLLPPVPAAARAARLRGQLRLRASSPRPRSSSSPRSPRAGRSAGGSGTS